MITMGQPRQGVNPSRREGNPRAISGRGRTDIGLGKCPSVRAEDGCLGMDAN